MPTKKLQSRKVFRAKPVPKTRKSRTKKPQSAGGAWHTPTTSEGEIYAYPDDLSFTNSNSDCPNGIKLKNVNCAYMFGDFQTAITQLFNQKKIYTFWQDQDGKIVKLKRDTYGKIGQIQFNNKQLAELNSQNQTVENTITAPGIQEQEQSINLEPIKQSLKRYQTRQTRTHTRNQTIKRSDRRSSTKLGTQCKPNESTQYSSIPQRLQDNIIPENPKKNRYGDILPYTDNTRVTIGKENAYINASYINIDLSTNLPKKKYIATQCPIGENEKKLVSTIADFWKMIWEQDTKVISMLVRPDEKTTGGAPKCTQYYPTSVGSSMTYGDIKVEVTKKTDEGGIHITELKLKKKTGFFRRNTEAKIVTHLYYNNWPDKQTPSETDYTKIKKMSELIDQYSGESTPVVHCSAGVGRTGTMIAINYLLNLLKLGLFECSLIFQTVLQLRQGRPHMVQTEDQYEYIFNFMNKAVSEKSK